jgi:hypothetical protein
MLELPHVNVLSKIDLMESYGKLGMQYILLSQYNLNFDRF